MNKYIRYNKLDYYRNINEIMFEYYAAFLLPAL